MPGAGDIPTQPALAFSSPDDICSAEVDQTDLSAP